MDEQTELVGSLEHTIEIDESVFGKRKFQQRRVWPAVWDVLTGMPKIFLTRVKQRDRITLHVVIQDYLGTQSALISERATI